MQVKSWGNVMQFGDGSRFSVGGLRSLLRSGARALSALAGQLRPQATARPAWERSVLDDIAARRPWNLRLKAERRIALARLKGLQDGVTVIIVNWNTKDVTADVIHAVRRLSPPDTRILVVDNGSHDGTREMLQGLAGVHSILLPANVGHGVALDLAVYRTRTTVAVTLDSDAIPLRASWLDATVPSVRGGQAVLAGLRARRNFVHPVYSALNTAEFIKRRLSFQTFVPPNVTAENAVWGENAWDTAELLTPRLHPTEVHFVDRTPNLVPGLPGMTTGDVVYHHGGVSRGTAGSVEPAALAGWREACRRLADAVEAQNHAADASGRARGISVVMPVLNAASTIREQLEALCLADPPAGPFEVLVADNGSTDDTADIARSFADRLPVTVVDASSAPGSNFARNCGIQESRFDRILLCDGDDQVDTRWLVAMESAFDAGHELVVGPIDYRRLNPSDVRKWRGADRAFDTLIAGFLRTGHGANMGFTRSLYERLNGFDDEFEFGGPDVEFCWRAQLAGADLHPVEEAVVHYRLRPSLEALARQSRAYGAAEAHLYKKFASRGVARRSASAVAKDLGWIITRAPLARSTARRGAWLRRWSTQVGRIQGSVRYRVWWW